MEILETQDPEKKKLIETSDRHKHEIQREVRDLSEKTERVLKNALIIGGTLAVTYFLVSQLGGSKTKKSKKSKVKTDDTLETNLESEPIPSEPTFLSKLGDRIISSATVVLLDIAKDKLADYLSNRKTRE